MDLGVGTRVWTKVQRGDTPKEEGYHSRGIPKEGILGRGRMSKWRSEMKSIFYARKICHSFFKILINKLFGPDR